MREIKFRGKTPEGKWIYGGISINYDRVWIDQEYYGDTFVDKETVGQYTGLKDKHGVKIYEGDIVNMHYFYENFDSSLGVYEDEKEIIGIIKINEYGVYLETKCNEIYYLCIYVQEPTEELEIIGNIWDAGGLLKESD